MRTSVGPLHGVLPPRRGLTAVGYALLAMLVILSVLTAVTAIGQSDVRAASGALPVIDWSNVGAR